MFREIRRHEKVTDIFKEKEEKGFMQIKPLEENNMTMEEINEFIFNQLTACHKEIMATMSD